MNKLLQNYSIQVDYPDVSGAEHLEVLQIRDRLAEAESDFTDEERAILMEADRKLMMNTTKVHTVDRRDFTVYRWNDTHAFENLLI